MQKKLLKINDELIPCHRLLRHIISIHSIRIRICICINRLLIWLYIWLLCDYLVTYRYLNPTSVLERSCQYYAVSHVQFCPLRPASIYIDSICTVHVFYIILHSLTIYHTMHTRHKIIIKDNIIIRLPSKAYHFFLKSFNIIFPLISIWINYYNIHIRLLSVSPA